MENDNDKAKVPIALSPLELARLNESFYQTMYYKTQLESANENYLRAKNKLDERVVAANRTLNVIFINWNLETGVVEIISTEGKENAS